MLSPVKMKNRYEIFRQCVETLQREPKLKFIKAEDRRDSARCYTNKAIIYSRDFNMVKRKSRLQTEYDTNARLESTNRKS